MVKLVQDIIFTVEVFMAKGLSLVHLNVLIHHEDTWHGMANS